MGRGVQSPLHNQLSYGLLAVDRRLQNKWLTRMWPMVGGGGCVGGIGWREMRLQRICAQSLPLQAQIPFGAFDFEFE